MIASLPRYSVRWAWMLLALADVGAPPAPLVTEAGLTLPAERPRCTCGGGGEAAPAGRVVVGVVALVLLLLGCAKPSAPVKAAADIAVADRVMAPGRLYGAATPPLPRLMFPETP